MNKIKFMVWIKPNIIYPNGRMVRVAGLCFDGDNTKVEVPRKDKENIKGFAWDNPDNFEFWYLNEECILRRPTGLKDKNGKEIYEGDIIRFNKFPINEKGKLGKEIDQVGYNEGCGMFQCLIPSWWSCKDKEIIGNIYENPKLTGGKE